MDRACSHRSEEAVLDGLNLRYVEEREEGEDLGGKKEEGKVVRDPVNRLLCDSVVFVDKEAGGGISPFH